MIDQPSHEDLMLGWIEDTLDAAQRLQLELLISDDPALGRRLESMREQRLLISGLEDPPAPSDLFDQVERAVARPLLSSATPGQFRRHNRPSMILFEIRRRLPIAAMFTLGLGFLAVLFLLNPLQWFQSPNDMQVAIPDSAQKIQTLLAGGQEVPQPGEPESFGMVGGMVPGTPPPLALVLAAGNQEAALRMLRTLAMRTDATLLANASPLDLMGPTLMASGTPEFGGSGGSANRGVGGGGRGGGANTAGGGNSILMEVEGVLLGDASQVPTIEDQFAFADEGAEWTVTIPLERFEGFLLVLDELAADGSALVLLEDHLTPDAKGGRWSQLIRARKEWKRWQGAPADTMIVIPVFAGTLPE